MSTFVISMKLLVALVITSIPVLFLFYVKPKSKREKKWKNLFNLIGANSKILIAVKKKFHAFTKSFANGLKYNKSIRKFYVIIMVIFMLATEIIDTNLSRTIAGYAIKAQAVNHNAVLEILYPLMTHPAATVTAFFLSVLLLSYTISNRVLTRLHRNTALFVVFSIIDIILAAVYSGRFILLSLVLLLLLNASCYYPEMYKGKTSGTYTSEKKQARNNREEQEIKS